MLVTAHFPMTDRQVTFCYFVYVEKKGQTVQMALPHTEQTLVGTSYIRTYAPPSLWGKKN